ncbi:hypothetical protein RFI_24291, partial [Reticulomyxa filosa]
RLEGMPVEWRLSQVQKTQMARFVLPTTRMNIDWDVRPGMQVRLTHRPCKELEKGWSKTGVVHDVKHDCEVTLIFKEGTVDFKEGLNEPEPEPFPTDITTGFDIEVVWIGVPYKRMREAVQKLVTDEFAMTEYLLHTLLGNEVKVEKSEYSSNEIKYNLPDDWNVPNLPPLNDSQIAAIRHCLERPLSLIQGPPGTGKTVTAAAIVYHLVAQKKDKVLVVAPSNTAVDHLTLKLHATGMKVVRVAAKSREGLPYLVENLMLHNMVSMYAQFAKGQDHKLWKLLRKKQKKGELSRLEEIEFKLLWRKIEIKILNAVDVICCTCSSAADDRLKNLVFKRVLVDEATQAQEPECLIPLVNGAQQIILVGDHCQLGPVIKSSQARQASYQISMFERLVQTNIRPMRLQIQYRMHPCLSEFSSNTFYEGSLKNGVTAQERYH